MYDFNTLNNMLSVCCARNFGAASEYDAKNHMLCEQDDSMQFIHEFT